MTHTHAQEIQALLRIFLFFSILLNLANGEESNTCASRYLTVNTYSSVTSMSISCYSIDEDCQIFHSPAGNGCASETLLHIGNVSAMETEVVDYALTYGDALCSNYQISVQFTSNEQVVAVLPRATQAGTKFHSLFDYLGNERLYECSILALATPASVIYSRTLTDSDTNLTIDSYQMQTIDLHITASTFMVLKIFSDAPVIVSCKESSIDNARLLVLEPISSQPLLAHINRNGYISVAVSDCSTNANLSPPNSDLVRWDMSGRAGRSCYESQRNGGRTIMVANGCVVVLTPIHSGTCISAILQNSAERLSAIGLPESKLTSILVRYPYNSIHYVFSFHESTCQFSTQSQIERTTLEWIPGDLQNKVSGGSILRHSLMLNWVSCSEPVYTDLYQSEFIQFRGGYQAEELWTDFFVSEGCNIRPDPTLTPPPVQTPPPEITSTPLDQTTTPPEQTPTPPEQTPTPPEETPTPPEETPTPPEQTPTPPEQTTTQPVQTSTPSNKNPTPQSSGAAKLTIMDRSFSMCSVSVLVFLCFYLVPEN